MQRWWRRGSWSPRPSSATATAPRRTSPATCSGMPRLEKPSFRPSGPTIGMAWMALDVLLAYGGTRLLAAPPTRSSRIAASGWATAIVGLALYPWLMFGQRRLGAALASVVGMFGGAITAVAAGASVDRRAAKALLPLVAWLGFAGVLQEEIWRRNR